MQKNDDDDELTDCDAILAELEDDISYFFGELPTQHYVIAEEPPKKSRQATKSPKKAAKKSK